jgi:putative addiction module CopG family antidote
MQISLPAELEKYIEEQVKTGHYPTPDAVVENALEILKIQQAGLPSGEELQRLIAEGQAEADRGELLPASKVFGELREHSATRRSDRA